MTEEIIDIKGNLFRLTYDDQYILTTDNREYVKTIIMKETCSTCGSGENGNIKVLAACSKGTVVQGGTINLSVPSITGGTPTYTATFYKTSPTGTKTTLFTDTNLNLSSFPLNHNNVTVPVTDAVGTWTYGIDVVDSCTGTPKGTCSSNCTIDVISAIVLGSVYPATIILASGGSYTFTALDTSGNPIVSGVTWAATGGTINTSGQYTAPTVTVSTNYTITATYGGISKTAVATVNPAKSVTVTVPNGGENWIQGTSHNVTWTYTGSISTVRIDLYKGTAYSGTVATGVTASSGSYSWTVQSALAAGTDYRIRIVDESDTNINDYSNNYFTISTAVATICTWIDSQGGPTGFPGQSIRILTLIQGYLGIVNLGFTVTAGYILGCIWYYLGNVSTGNAFTGYPNC